MIRLILRRDRIRIPLWIAAIAGVIVGSAASVTEGYATQEEINAYAASVGANPAVVAMNGPAYALDTIGGVVVYETTLIGVVGVALMSLLFVTRHTRTEEETGRAELIQAGVVGGHARLAATLVVVAATNLLLGGLLAIGLASIELPLAARLPSASPWPASGLFSPRWPPWPPRSPSTVAPPQASPARFSAPPTCCAPPATSEAVFFPGSPRSGGPRPCARSA